MINTEIKDSLLRVAYALKDSEGKSALSDVIEQLYDKGHFLKVVDDNLSFNELLASEECARWFKLARVETDGKSEQILQLTEEGLAAAEKSNAARHKNPQSLFQWAFMGHFDERLDLLAKMALPESWDEGDKRNGVLSSYLTNTFRRLLHERKEGNDRAIIETEKWAAFNTGLVDRVYDPIFALFALNKRTDVQKWVFQSWCTPGNKRSGQILSRFFDKLPKRASYFSNPSELLYDEHSGVPTLPFDHILERLDRLPASFLKNYVPEGMTWPEDSTKLTEEFYNEFREQIYNDDYVRLLLKDALELSLRRAIKRVVWNYRMALPVYDVKRRKIMLLIPMALDPKNSEKIDIALMVERAKVSRKYLGHTILTLPMAYRKARMIMRPEADWLSESLLEDHHKTTDYMAVDEEETNLALEISESNADAIAADREVKAQEESQRENETDIFLYQHENNEIYRPEAENQPKVIDKIDLNMLGNNPKRDKILHPSAYAEETATDSEATVSGDNDIPEKERYSSAIHHPYRPKEERDFNLRGIYHANYGKPFIEKDGYRYAAREFTDTDLIEEDDVIFDIESEPNIKGTGSYYYAVNIRLADDYDD